MRLASNDFRVARHGGFRAYPKSSIMAGSCPKNGTGKRHFSVYWLPAYHRIALSDGFGIGPNAIRAASRLHRNGVGVATNGEFVFPMTNSDSEKFPNLHESAVLFRMLGCEDAFFPDGDLSQM
jgi:hypothetical protein